MNTVYIGHLMDALQSLSQVPDTELAQRAIAAKVKALSNSNTAGKRGKELIDAMTDEELVIALREGEGQFTRPMSPQIFQHIDATRPQVWGVLKRMVRR